MRFFTLEKINRLLPEIRQAIHQRSIPIPAFKFIETDVPCAQAADFDDRSWADFPIPGFWGGYDVIAWFRAHLDVPPELREKKLALQFLAGPRDGYGSTAEVLLYVNGQPLQGIDVWHEEAVLPPEIAAGGRLSIALRAWSGVIRVPPRRHFKLAQLVQIDEPTETFFYLANTIALALPMLDANDLRRVKLEETLNDAFHRIDFIRTGTEAFYQSVRSALDFLQDALVHLQRDELKPKVVAVGHSHIDMAWMWRLERTREKAARTFTTVLNLMRQYPEYRFAASSPQHYKALKQDQLDIFSRVKEQVQAGRWEVLGGSWIEMDTLIPSGESLVRQVLFGKRFARQEFGVDPKTLWLPDSFGFTALLPTIMKSAGLEGFSTSVISYSKFGRFPYDTFRWRGLDGSEVLVNFITTPAETGRSYNYIGRLEPYDTKLTWDNNRQKEFFTEVLLPFGWGDGGGGPTVQMIQSAAAMHNLPGIPYVEIGKVGPFFERLLAQTAGKDLPVVDGELYLEALRGAYTSQSSNKRANHDAEILYHNSEWLNALADTLTGESHYPQVELNRGWEIILLNQFHDILSGTSITPVHADSMKDYEKVDAIGQQTFEAARSRIVSGVKTRQPGLLVFNPLGWEVNGLVEVPWQAEFNGKTFLDAASRPAMVQPFERAGQKMLLVEVTQVPSLGYRFYPLVEQKAISSQNPLKVSNQELESPFYHLKLNEHGQITSLLVDGREALPENEPANQLQVFEDRPVEGEAWEIDPYYQEKLLPLDAPVEWTVEETGPLRGVIHFKYRFDRSTITQRLVVYAGSRRIDFKTELDWFEHQAMLKAAFPVQVRARQATYDLGFGSLERPTHWNTPFDAAHFENPAQRWVDLSEEGFGVALLNDGKYGYDVRDHTLRLTLHRSPTEPDPQADQGHHTFTYSMLPHLGTWKAGRVRQEAGELNNPLQGAFIPANLAGSLPESFQWVASSDPGIIVDTVKKAEDGPAWIVRVFEAYQQRSDRAQLMFGKPVQKAVSCNLLEEDQQPVEFTENRVTFSIQPFELKTFKVWF